MLQWQYAEGLLDEPELFNWILGQFKYDCVRMCGWASDDGVLTVALCGGGTPVGRRPSNYCR